MWKHTAPPSLSSSKTMVPNIGYNLMMRYSVQTNTLLSSTAASKGWKCHMAYRLSTLYVLFVHEENILELYQFRKEDKEKATSCTLAFQNLISRHLKCFSSCYVFQTYSISTCGSPSYTGSYWEFETRLI